jgi:LysM repeat protein
MAKYYIVKPGDTLWTISIKIKISIKILIELNFIDDPDRIYVGQRLRIE